jgi:hypothetical protein
LHQSQLSLLSTQNIELRHFATYLIEFIICHPAPPAASKQSVDSRAASLRKDNGDITPRYDIDASKR